MGLLIFLIWAGVTGATSIVAGYKGRSSIGWLLLGAVFGIFALIAVALLPNLDQQREAHDALLAIARATPLPDRDGKLCPSCAETVKAAALKCRFCGHEFAPPPVVEIGPGERLCDHCGKARRNDPFACPHCDAAA